MNIKIKKLIVYAAIFFVCLIVILSVFYGLIAFVKWEANPQEWGKVTRLVGSFISAASIVFSNLITDHIVDNE